MKVSVSVLMGIPLIRVEGEVDHRHGAELQSALRNALNDGGAQVLIDLESCAYLDSASLGVLLRMVEQVGAKGWVGVVRPTRMALRLFELVGLTGDPDFRVFTSLEDVQRALTGREA